MSEYTGLIAFVETDPTSRYIYARLENQFRDTIFTSAFFSEELVAATRGECLQEQLRMAYDFACDRSRR